MSNIDILPAVFITFFLLYVSTSTNWHMYQLTSNCCLEATIGNPIIKVHISRVNANTDGK